MQKIAVLSLIIANVGVSLYGFNQRAFFERYMFHVGSILRNKSWERLIVSGFLHVNIPHLFLNMYCLYVFGQHLEEQLGPAVFLLLYGVSLLGGDAFALFFHRNHPDYSAVGASGAVSGVVFASIFLLPDFQIMVFPIPFWMPTWIYALVYTAGTLFGIRSQRDNIGHEAHLGGAISGMLIAAVLQPRLVVAENPWLFFGILIPVGAFLAWFAYRPGWLGRRGAWRAPRREPRLPPSRRTLSPRERQKEELDRLLDKISAGGLSSLSPEERERLDRISRELRESGRN